MGSGVKRLTVAENNPMQDQTLYEIQKAFQKLLRYLKDDAIYKEWKFIFDTAWYRVLYSKDQIESF